MKIQLNAGDKLQEFEVIQENEETETHVIQLHEMGEIVTIPFIYDNNGFPKVFA